MKFRNILTLVLAVSLFGTAAFAVAPVPVANADCSFNGYYHSGGKCSKSYKAYVKGDDDDDDRYQYQYEYRYQNNNFGDQALLAMIERLQEMIRQLEDRLANQQENDSDAEVRVATRSAIDVEEDAATLRGRLYLDGADEADVYFEYGRTRTDLDDETDAQNIEDGDNLYFEEDIDDLRDDTRYYFRAVAEDEDGEEAYGTIYSFITDDENNDEEPSLDTHNATEIDEDSAELNGEVDMNDFNNGRVFFVYGEDESDVEDVADDYDQYSDIEEQGDDLQKVSIDSDLDGSATYYETVTNLDPNTDIYYSICVEYEDADEDDVIKCGDVESFETD